MPDRTSSSVRPASERGHVSCSSLTWPRLDAFGREVEHLHDTAQARVAGQRREEGPRMGQPSALFLDVGCGAEQQSIAFKETAAIRLSHAAKQIRFLREGLRELIGRHLGVFGRRRLHDRRDSLLGKCLVQLHLAFMPGQLLRDQPFDVGVDGKPIDVEYRRPQRQQHPGNDDHPPVGARRSRQFGQSFHSLFHREQFDLLAKRRSVRLVGVESVSHGSVQSRSTGRYCRCSPDASVGSRFYEHGCVNQISTRS